MHILGFYHEQQRDDRDQYVNVLYNNINPGEKRSRLEKVNSLINAYYNYKYICLAFQQVSYEKKSTAQGMANNLGTPYDYSMFRNIGFLIIELKMMTWFFLMADSIMHYHAYSFSTDPSKPAMTATDGCSLFGNEIQFSRVRDY